MDASSTDVEQVTRIRRCGTDRIEHDGTWYLDVTMKCAESGLFGVLGFDLLRGDPGQVLDRPHTAVVTSSLAERLFGQEDPIGRTLPIQVFDTLAAVEITGVMADIPKNTHSRPTFSSHAHR
ncbi:MAG: ABC transporter permease [Rhodothermales bacterium]|nr:ABC transporter permease [Rhodothermales bacterium]